MFSSILDDTRASFDASASTVVERSHRDLVRLGLRRRTTGTGVSPSHTYSAAGTYTVTSTVTDSAGSEGSVTKQVVVHLLRPPTSPTPSPGLASSFDGTSSTATDGATITGYLWNFGDGETSTEAKPVHTYAADGTYDVRLTVTDSLGATSTATAKQVTVKALDVFAADAFGRTAGTGWAAADVGGTWTRQHGVLRRRCVRPRDRRRECHPHHSTAGVRA